MGSEKSLPRDHRPQINVPSIKHYPGLIGLTKGTIELPLCLLLDHPCSSVWRLNMAVQVLINLGAGHRT